jgi:polyisoprenoid-binding protein YceI
MMEEHFNSDYMESEKYPSSTFKGAMTGINNVDVGKDGTYTVNITGSLEIHGISKNITNTGTIIIKDGKLSATSVFKIILKDYNIEIPSIVVNNISKQIDITVSCQYEKRSSN